VPAEQFIWLRNAGNIITAPLSSTMRSLALACAVKGGKEIAIIGHTDCQVARTTTIQLLDKLKELGVERNRLPDNINDFFGMFASERQNVIKACDIVRHSPLIGPKIPVHGLLVDTETGRLDWIVNGYQTLETAASHAIAPAPPIGQTTDNRNFGQEPFQPFPVPAKQFALLRLWRGDDRAERRFIHRLYAKFLVNEAKLESACNFAGAIFKHIAAQNRKRVLIRQNL
jgi:hypothetical protein